VQISELVQLDLKSKPELQEIWNGSLHIPDLCFSGLTTLKVNDCRFLSDAVLPFHLLSSLPKLEILKVENCDSVKTIFDVKCATQDTLVTFPLKNLFLFKLPNLKNVWNENPHGILSMHHLREVNIEDCKCLKTVFPVSVARDIVELENLVVKDCEGLMTIVAEDNTDQSLELTSPCPCVRSLKIWGLTKFKYFYYCSLKSDIYTPLDSHTKNQLGTQKVLFFSCFLLFIIGSVSAN